jgi:hypothetical protein
MYEAALKPSRTTFGTILYWTWVVVGLTTLISLAWAEPFSNWLFAALIAKGVAPLLIKFVGIPVVMLLRACLAVESVGYVYHRFFQHVGFMTRQSQLFRRNQKFHWIHHMIIYPIGRVYKRRVAYVPSEHGVSLSWVVPGILVAGSFLATQLLVLGGTLYASLIFIFGLWAWAKLIVDTTHSRFHEQTHPWMNSNYFHWLEDIHVLHHWDQRTNYTIWIPWMDQLFGTFLDPKKHGEELKIALEDHELTVSDVINWRYLLIEATPAERAAFVSNAKQYPRSCRKVEMLLALLDHRIAAHPEDREAQAIKTNAIDMLRSIGKDPAQSMPKQ